MIHRRFWIAAGHHLMRAPVAILASCRRRAFLARHRMSAVLVSFLRIRMAFPAGHLPGRRIVRQALHIRVAIHAPKQPPMDRVLQLPRIHKQAKLLSIHIGRQRLIRVAGKAIRIFKFLRTMRHGGPDKQRQTERIDRNSSCSVHAYEEMLRREISL